MLKVTKNINLKAAVAGAAILTTLSYLNPSSAHALVFRWGGFPDTFKYDFTIDTEQPATSAVQSLIIEDTSTGLGSASNSVPLEIQLTEFVGDRTLLDTIFDNINCPDKSCNGFDGIDGDDRIIDNNIFLYSITLDQKLQDFVRAVNGGNGFTSIGFVVPTNFTVDNNPITFNTDKFTDPLSGLEEIATVLGNSGGNVQFPIVTDNNLIENPAQGYSFSITNQTPNTKVPESSTNLSILGLGILGVSTVLKRKQQTNTLS